MKELGYFVYQIYPKSFMDTTGNGIGDINGIRAKLSYIADLGFDYIWITPIYISPQRDNGYDVADYYHIDPLFGSEEDFDNLVKEAEVLGLKIMMDMVFNHTSSDHEWFKRALAGEKKYQDYYIWREETTTWESKFGGSAWKYSEKLKKNYLHLFDVSQPDLNWENEQVRQEIYNIVNYWITRGVKGFRFDVINLVSKRYPLSNGKGDGREQYTDGPRIHEFLKEMRENTFAENNDILTVGEMSSTSIQECRKYATKERTELDSVFHFHHLKVDYQNAYKWSTDFFDFPMLKELLTKWQIEMQSEDVVDTLFWSCHDQPRIASRFIKARDEKEQLRKNKSLAMMMYLMRGISYIYQGEELGMENLNFKSIEEVVDIEALNFYKHNNNLSVEQRLKALSQKSRDNARTPMQWTKVGGFTTSKPWIKYNENLKYINCEEQISNPDSTYHFYKGLINLKKNDETLKYGAIKFDHTDDLFIYTRSMGDIIYKIIINVWDKEFTYPEEVNQVIINNGCEISKVINLKPFSSILYKLSK